MMGVSIMQKRRCYLTYIPPKNNAPGASQGRTSQAIFALDHHQLRGCEVSPAWESAQDAKFG